MAIFAPFMIYFNKVYNWNVDLWSGLMTAFVLAGAMAGSFLSGPLVYCQCLYLLDGKRTKISTTYRRRHHRSLPYNRIIF